MADWAIVVTDASWAPVASYEDYELDEAYGDDENDFELSLPEGAPELEPGSLWFVPGTEWGGVVDSVRSQVSRGARRVTYGGRAWAGVLAAKVVVPDAGADHYSWAGDANDCLRSLLGRLGLLGLFSVPSAASGIEVSCEFARFCDAWSGVRAALRTSGARPAMRWEAGSVLLWAAPAVTHGSGADSDLIDIDVRRDHRPVNHLVCAGEGELSERAVVHLYADEAGAVSGAQTLFGADEVAALYDYSNADAAELEEEGRRKLLDYQVEGEVSVTVRDEGLEFAVGDSVTGRESGLALQVTAEVVKKIARHSLGVLSVSYECGQASSTRGLSGSSESSGGGGATYYAGEGLSLVGNTFSADVTEADVERLDADVDEVRRTASDAAEAASGTVKTVAGYGFVTVAREGDAVTVGAEVVSAADVNSWFA